MNIFARKIGFFYKNREWAEEIFHKIIDMTDTKYLSGIRHARGEMQIIYADGTIVKFVEALEKARCHRFHMIYLEPTISYEFYNNVAMPYLMSFTTGWSSAYVLSDSKALYREWSDTGFCMDAKEYYRQRKEAIDQLVKLLDDRIIKECEFAKTHNDLATQIKIAELENFSKSAYLEELSQKEKQLEKRLAAINEIGKWVDENPDIEDHDTMEKAIDNTLNEIKKKRPSYTLFCGSLEEVEKAAHNGDIIQQDDCGIWWLKRIEDDCK